MENPFELINTRLERIENLLHQLHTKIKQPQVNSVSKLMNTDEVAAYLNLAKPTIYAKVRTNMIPYSKVGNRLYFDTETITNWVNNNNNNVKTLDEV